MVEKPRRGRWPEFVDTKSTPFNDRGKLAGSVEDLRSSVDDLWVGYTKRAIQEYRRVRDKSPRRSPMPPIRDRTFTKRAGEWDEAMTGDGKRFYFKDPLPAKARERIARVRVGG